MSIVEDYQNSRPGIFQGVYQSVDPSPVSPSPTERDYKRGYMFRYFLKSKSPSGRLPFEVDSNQFESFQSRGKGISRSSYEGIEIKWMISGPKEKQFNSLGYPVQVGVRDTNSRLVELYENEMKGISQILDDPLEYHREVS